MTELQMQLDDIWNMNTTSSVTAATPSVSSVSSVSSASERGYELEQKIHDECQKLDLICALREKEIQATCQDTSLNGVDHWITYGTHHVLIQDKWKETTSQPEVAQFLTCVKRIRDKHIPLTDTVHLIWASKTEPTSNGRKLLEEQNVQIIVWSGSISGLARRVYTAVGDLIDMVSSQSIVVYVKPIVAKSLTYDETDEGKQQRSQLDQLATSIMEKLARVHYVLDSCGGEPRQAGNPLLPITMEQWSNTKKIDYTTFLKVMKTYCVPSAKKMFPSHYYECYAKCRYLSTQLSPLVLSYTNLRDKMIQAKSLWTKQHTPIIKCLSEPMGQAEYTGAIKYASGYWNGAEMNFATHYYNV